MAVLDCEVLAEEDVEFEGTQTATMLTALPETLAQKESIPPPTEGQLYPTGTLVEF